MEFEVEWSKLKGLGIHGAFAFNGGEQDWRPTVNNHFKVPRLGGRIYGVYIVRQKSTGAVIYIGKAGTMKQHGAMKDQDLTKRLVNREKGLSRRIVFAERVRRFGDLLIEYVKLDPKETVPSFAEALLIQAYFRENGALPPDNTAY